MASPHMNQLELTCRWRRCPRLGPYSTPEALFEHLDTDHVPRNADDALTCERDGCSRMSPVKGQMSCADHHRTHAKYRPFKCTKTGCDAAFSSEYSLRKHIKGRAGHAGARAALVIPGPAPPPRRTLAARVHPAPSSGLLQCLWNGCMQTYSGDTGGAAQLAAHLATDHRSLPCRWAGCMRNLKGSLFSHLRTHLPAWYRPFVCQHCGKAFSRPESLKRHRTNVRVRQSHAHGHKRPRTSRMESDGDLTREYEVMIDDRIRSASSPISPSPLTTLPSTPGLSHSPPPPPSEHDDTLMNGDARAIGEENVRVCEDLAITNAALHDRLLFAEGKIEQLEAEMESLRTCLASGADQGRFVPSFPTPSSQSEKEDTDDDQDWSLDM
ncbi:hypothetical protein AURDEDRAFT_166321 [Auricularia subglabra TFB-10046 SS5]|uniref:C2H2-type domain-containing protein n=1 Tax=Auricularia subglabra (strain TFB-10046 / SS5) TaxID=717982 RepID=J0WZ14_AURST|nr:hypothetical protein AURDEDRAFT_166321 [Auricularia subglabra TFB-10046 SS5]